MCCSPRLDVKLCGTVLDLFVDMLVKLVFNEFWLRLYKMLSIWLRLLQYVLYQFFLDLFIFWLRLCENCTEISENNYLDVLPVTGIGINFYSCTRYKLLCVCCVCCVWYDIRYELRHEIRNAPRRKWRKMIPETIERKPVLFFTPSFVHTSLSILITRQQNDVAKQWKWATFTNDGSYWWK